MANVRLVFSGTERSGTDDMSLVCYANSENEIFLQIYEGDSGDFICLDKETAIKLHKELKKQISFLHNETV